MSHIPNKAIPHAGGDPDHRQPDGLDNGQTDESSGGGSTISRLKDAARGNPKTAIAAGVAITAGIAAAVAVPIARAARGKSDESKSGEEKGGGQSTKSKGSSKKKD